MRRKIIAGNWKMTLDLNKSLELVRSVVSGMSESLPPQVSVMLGPSFPFLLPVQEIVKGKNQCEVFAQNVSSTEKGAYTGQVSPAMIQSLGIRTVLIGHSECRSYLHENDSVIAQKIHNAFAHNLQVILAVGETLEKRNDGRHITFVNNQIQKAVSQLKAQDIKNLIIAYEPIWAIGTGKTATPQQANEMHASIHQLLIELFPRVGDNVSILYGGSVKPENALELFSQPHIDGGLIGGASLDIHSFLRIIQVMENICN